MKKWLEKVKSKQSRLSILKRYYKFTDKNPKVLTQEHQIILFFEINFYEKYKIF